MKQRSSRHGRNLALARYAPAIGIIAMLIAFMILGGSSRPTVTSLLVIRPLAAALFVWTLAQSIIRRTLFANLPALILLAWTGWMAIQLVPLPPNIWSALPGRAPIVASFAVAGVPLGWQPLSVRPMSTLNALLAMLVPLSVVLLLRLGGRERLTLAIYAVLGFGALTMLLAILQVVGGANAALYPFGLPREPAPVGLFANRNHQAAVLAAIIPMMLAAAQAARMTDSRFPYRWLGILAAFVAVIVVVMTGSRLGTLLALGALAIGAFLTNRSDRPLDPRRANAGQLFVHRHRVILPLVLLALVAVIFWFASGYAFERIASKDNFGDLRFSILPTNWQMAKDAFPFGWGFGTFPDVYMMYEETGLMVEFYINRAHNDWLEILIEGGLVSGLLAATLLVMGVVRAFRLRGTIVASVTRWDYLRGGALIGLIVLLGASLTDYPLRTPATATLFAIYLAIFFAPQADR